MHYRALNELTVKDDYALSRINDSFDDIIGMVVLGFDIKTGYQ